MEMVIDTAVKYNDIFMSGVKITIIISILSCFSDFCWVLFLLS